jgi:hypothetical protein
VGSAPFPLFARIILPPVLSRAYSAPATLFNLIHKTKTSDRVDQTSNKGCFKAHLILSVTDWIEGAENGKGVRHEDERLSN